MIPPSLLQHETALKSAPKHKIYPDAHLRSSVNCGIHNAEHRRGSTYFNVTIPVLEPHTVNHNGFTKIHKKFERVDFPPGDQFKPIIFPRIKNHLSYDRKRVYQLMFADTCMNLYALYWCTTSLPFHEGERVGFNVGCCRR